LLLAIKGEYIEAESLYRRVLAFYENSLGAGHPDTVVVLSELTMLRKK